MNSLNRRHAQAGFSLIEMLLSLGLMMVLMGIVFTVTRDSFRTSFTAMELTDAQEGMRAAHEIISRDLITAGDGLNGINTIRLRVGFVSNYLTASPVPEPSPNSNFVNLSVITSDNNVPAGRAVPQASPAVTVRSSPVPTDRLTLLQIDPTFTPIALPGNAILPAGANVTVAAADIGRFSVGDIVFITSTNGATFSTITNIGGTVLTMGNGDVYGMNLTGNGGPIGFVTANGTLPTSIMRMQIIHYFVNSDGLLIRRVFGVPGGVGFRDSVIAEHVVDMQFRYALNLFNADRTIMQPVAQLINGTQQVNVRQVETSLNLETTHGLMLNGAHPNVKMTTSTSVRNMQFRQALMPTAGG